MVSFRLTWRIIYNWEIWRSALKKVQRQRVLARVVGKIGKLRFCEIGLDSAEVFKLYVKKIKYV